MTVDPIVPLAALEHYEYCPRQCALIHVDNIWQDNAHTVRGNRGHQRVDSGETKRQRGVTVLRSIPLWSELHGLSGRADAVEIDDSGTLTPVEYKIGRRHGLATDVQLCAQVICLEEMSQTEIPAGLLWLAAPRQRVTVAMDPPLRRATLARITKVRRMLTGGGLPPAPNDQRCGQCQFLGRCLPDLVADPDRVGSYLKHEVLSCGS